MSLGVCACCVIVVACGGLSFVLCIICVCVLSCGVAAMFMLCLRVVVC